MSLTARSSSTLCFTSCLFSSANFFCFCFAYFAIVGIFQHSFWSRFFSFVFSCPLFCLTFASASRKFSMANAHRLKSQKKANKKTSRFDMQISLVARHIKWTNGRMGEWNGDLKEQLQNYFRHSFIHSFIYPAIHPSIQLIHPFANGVTSEKSWQFCALIIKRFNLAHKMRHR